MTKKILLLILLSLFLNSHAWAATNWCDDANTEVCVTYEDGGSDPTDKSQNEFTITNNGVSITSGSPPDTYSTYYGDYEQDNPDQMTLDDPTGILDYEGNGEDFSLCMWVDDENSSSYTGLMAIYDTNDDFWRFMIWNDEKLNLSLDAIDTFSDSVLSSTGWQHICVTADRDGSSVFYQNGVADGGGALSSEALDITSTTLVFGDSHNVGQDYDGLMDEHLVYTGLLDPTDINEIMIGGLVGVSPEVNWCEHAEIGTCLNKEEGSGETTEDQSANNYDGTFLGAGEPNWSATVPGSGDGFQGDSDWSLDYDGSDDYISVTTMGSFGTGLDTDFLVFTTWFQTSDTSNIMTLAGQFNATDNRSDFEFVINKDNTDSLNAHDLKFFRRDDDARIRAGTVTKASGVADGNWHHVVFSVSDSAHNVYLDGVSQSVTQQTGNTADNMQNFENVVTIGARNLRGTPDVFFDGLIDETALFSLASAFDSTDINSIMIFGLVQTAPAAGRTRRFF